MKPEAYAQSTDKSRTCNRRSTVGTSNTRRSRRTCPRHATRSRACCRPSTSCSRATRPASWRPSGRSASCARRRSACCGSSASWKGGRACGSSVARPEEACRSAVRSAAMLAASGVVASARAVWRPARSPWTSYHQDRFGESARRKGSCKVAPRACVVYCIE